MQYQNIPDEMKQFHQWVVWKLEETDGDKPTKIPYSPINHRHAKVNDPSSWGTFEQCLHILQTPGWYTGLGFVLTQDDPYAFIDLDNTYNDQEKMDRQMKIFNEFDSYAEKSPSGNGLHIIVKGSLPSGRKRSSIEVYSNLRYMTMTGDVYREAPIRDFHTLINSLHEQMATNNQNGIVYAGLAEQKETDEVVYDRAYKAANGGKFADLWNGNWQDYYPSQSEADLALVDIIAFYSQNRAQISRMFRLSGLGKRDKAKRDDYVNFMLNKCFDRMLPPVDVEGLQNKIQEALDKKMEAEWPSEKAKKEKPKPEPKKDVYSVPPGLVGEIAQFIYAQAPRPVAEIALAGAIGMISGIVGRAYNVSGTGLNQYIIVLAKTGRGKEAPSMGIDKLFTEVMKTVPAAKEFQGPSDIASLQAVVKYMATGPKSFTCVFGEFGLKMQQMCATNAPSHLIGIREFLLKAFSKSGQGQIWHPSIYSDKKNNTDSIVAPAFSIFAESTPEKFYEGLHEGLITEGLLPRFSIIEYMGERPPLNEAHKSVKPSFELVEKLTTLCSYALTLNSQNKVIEVEAEPEAKQLLDDFSNYCDVKINKSQKDVQCDLWNRGHLKALKMAGIIAVGENPYNPKISKNVANWAINLVFEEAGNLENKFNLGQIGVENDENKQVVKATEVFRDFIIRPWAEVETYVGHKMQFLHSEKIVPFSYVQKRLAGLSCFRRDKMGASNALKRTLNTLTERGDIQEMSRADMSKTYNISARAFMISNPKTFGF